MAGFRVGEINDKFGRGTYFSGDQTGADAYSSLHPGHQTLRHEIDFDEMISPRLGATWSANGSNVVYGNYSRYYPAAS